MVSERQEEAARLQAGVSGMEGRKTRELSCPPRRPWSVTPPTGHPHRWRAPHRELSELWPSHLLALCVQQEASNAEPG